MESFSIALGSFHIYSIDDEGNAWSHGKYEYPLSSTKSIEKRYKLMNNPIQIVSISAGLEHWIGVSTEGKVYGIGSNISGQLGLPNSFFKKNNVGIQKPTLIPISKDVITSYCGDNHSFCICSDYTVYGFGLNNFNQLGIKSKSKKMVKTPTKVFELKNIVSIGSKSELSFFITRNGDVYYCGRDFKGLVIEKPILFSALSNIKRIRCAELFILILNNNDEVFIIDECYNIPKLISFECSSSVKDIYCGNTHAVLLESNNTIWTINRAVNTGPSQIVGCGGFNIDKSDTFTLVKDVPDNIIDIASGNDCTIVTNPEGVYCIGADLKGGLFLDESLYFSYEWNKAPNYNSECFVKHLHNQYGKSARYLNPIETHE